MQGVQPGQHIEERSCRIGRDEMACRLQAIPGGELPDDKEDGEDPGTDESGHEVFLLIVVGDEISRPLKQDAADEQQAGVQP